MLRIVAAAMGIWLHRARSRRALSMLDDRQLCDIGMAPSAASREAGKPFWRS